MKITACIWCAKGILIIIILGKNVRFWHSVTFAKSLLLKSLHLIWHLNAPQMRFDFLVLINVNPQVAGRVVLFPCQSADWGNYASTEEVMIPIKISKLSFKLLWNLFVCYILESLLLKLSLMIKEMLHKNHGCDVTILIIMIQFYFFAG